MSNHVSHKADVIVIGGGVQGASLAFHLAQRGVKVMVLEKQFIAAGATGRSSGLVRMHYDTEVEARLVILVEFDAKVRLGADRPREGEKRSEHNPAGKSHRNSSLGDTTDGRQCARFRGAARPGEYGRGYRGSASRAQGNRTAARSNGGSCGRCPRRSTESGL